MALPYDALTAALDAWLGQHIPNATRRARVRRSVDCLDDLRLAPLAHIKSMRTYGTRALRLTTDPPPGWTEVMLLTEHQEPVGRRSFQR